jgi:hypothetical protein
MKKKILLALLVSQISIHASMNQSALTKKTTGTLGEFIAQHKTTIGFVAAASLAAYHYREPIVGFIKNMFSSDLETSGSADAAVNQSSSLNTNTLDSGAVFLVGAARPRTALRDLDETRAARRLIYNDGALEEKNEANAFLAPKAVGLTAVLAGADLAATPTVNAAAAATLLEETGSPRLRLSDAQVHLIIENTHPYEAEQSALIIEAFENIVGALRTPELNEADAEVQAQMPISPRVEAIHRAQHAITNMASQSPKNTP